MIFKSIDVQGIDLAAYLFPDKDLSILADICNCKSHFSRQKKLLAIENCLPNVLSKAWDIGLLESDETAHQHASWALLSKIINEETFSSNEENCYVSNLNILGKTSALRHPLLELLEPAYVENIFRTHSFT
jgi:hypothetical protein